MKGIVKKNQIIITSLAILIAVAGYLNYTEKSVLDQTKKAKEAAEQVNDSAASSLDDVAANAEQEYASDTLLEGKDDILSNDSDVDVDSAVSENPSDDNMSGEETTTQESVPGEAVLTNVGTFSANARLQREQLRAKNKETLLNMINSGNLSEEQKSDITNEMLHITQIAELENAVETLLEAKGFSGAVVSISDNAVDVVVNMTDVSDEGRAQIEDIVKRKTEVPASNIVITPISVEN